LHKLVEALRQKSILLVAITLVVLVPLTGCAEQGGTVPTITATPTSGPTTTPQPHATGPTATISSVSGEVQVLKGGSDNWSDATSGMKLATGDGLQTGSDGYALIVFHEGSVMEIEADSEIAIEELSTSDTGSTSIRIKQLFGNAVNRVEQLADSASKYEVEMPAGTAAVRGTNFITKVYKNLGFSCTTTLCEEGDEDCKPVTHSSRGEHCVAFTAKGVSVEVCQGMKSCAWPGSPPTQPDYSDPKDDPTNLYDNSGSASSSNGSPMGPLPTTGW
jgi:hypothetical protein